MTINLTYLKRGLVLLGLFIAFAVGRYSVTGSVSVKRTDIVQAQTATAQTVIADSSSHIQVVVHKDVETTRQASGATVTVDKSVVTKEVVRDVIHEVVKTQVVTQTVTKEVEKRPVPVPRPDWRVGVDLGLTSSSSRLPLPSPVAGLSPLVSLAPIDYGLHVERRIGGPVWGGVRVTSDKSVGVSLSMEF